MPGVERYEDLEAWQIADELKREVYARTATGPASKDFKVRDQIRDSAASSTKNIAEGFGRLTKYSLNDGIDRGHFTPARVARAQGLADRSIQCSTKYIVYFKQRAKTWRRRRSP